MCTILVRGGPVRRRRRHLGLTRRPPTVGRAEPAPWEARIRRDPRRSHLRRSARHARSTRLISDSASATGTSPSTQCSKTLKRESASIMVRAGRPFPAGSIRRLIELVTRSPSGGSPVTAVLNETSSTVRGHSEPAECPEESGQALLIRRPAGDFNTPTSIAADQPQSSESAGNL